MNSYQLPKVCTARALIMLVAMCASASALAGAKSGANIEVDPGVRFQRDNAACNGMRDETTREQCRSVARSRHIQALPTPPEEQPEALARNLIQRCNALPLGLRGDCVARMQGQGTTSGSVAGGGIYRELVTREVGVAEVVQSPQPTPTANPPSAK